MTALLDLDRVRAGLRGGGAGAVDLNREVLARAQQDRLGAFAALCPDRAAADAERADAELAGGRDRGPWHGLPVAVKDVIDVEGVPTRNGTPGAGHRVPGSDAAVVARLREAGAVVVGKAATHELAFGMTTPSVRNPLDAARIVGGSSGGSAAAVAAGLAAAALGTDTNGSVRCPAALCGLAGLRPTQGALPRTGVSPLAWSQDTVGVIAASVEDCATLHRALTHALPLRERRARLRVGHAPRAWAASSQPGVAAACERALEGLAERGVEIVEVELQGLRDARAASFVTIMAEAAAAWRGELERSPDGFGPAVRASLRAGAELAAGAYLQSRRVRAHAHSEMRRLFEDSRLAALALPTLPVTAAPAGAATVTLGGREVAVEAAHARFCALAPATGQPALTVPCGLDEARLPVGLQLIGRPRGEEILFELGREVEALPGAHDVAEARRVAVVDQDERTYR